MFRQINVNAMNWGLSKISGYRECTRVGADYAH
jgi:hypothetical protein